MGRSFGVTPEKKDDYIVQEKAGKEIRRFKKIKLIGRGGFAEVFMCLDSKTNQEVAVKVMSREKLSKINGAREKLMTEVSVHKGLSHPHVVRFEEFFEDYYHFYIVLELCLGENLETLLRNERRFDEDKTRHYMRQLIEALIYLRDNKVIHRDLKLANLFADSEGTVKLGDFGLACKHDNTNRKRKSVCGTPNYIAPEMLGGEGHSFAVDTWAVGILLFAMLIGKPPFETSNMKMTYNRIQSCMYVFPPDREISTAAKMLIQKILNKNPAKRPTFEEILDSDFFKEGAGIVSSSRVIASTVALKHEENKTDQESTEHSSPQEFGRNVAKHPTKQARTDRESAEVSQNHPDRVIIDTLASQRDSEENQTKAKEIEKTRPNTKEEVKSVKIGGWTPPTNTVKPSWSKGSLFGATPKNSSHQEPSPPQNGQPAGPIQSNPVKAEVAFPKPVSGSPTAKEPAILKKIFTTLEVKPSAHNVEPPSAKGIEHVKKTGPISQANTQTTAYVWGSKAASTQKAPLWGSTSQASKQTTVPAATPSMENTKTPAAVVPASKEPNAKLLFLSQSEKPVTPPPEPKKVVEATTSVGVWGSKPAKNWYISTNQGSPQKGDSKPVSSTLTSSAIYPSEEKDKPSARNETSPAPKLKPAGDDQSLPQRMASKGRNEDEIRPRKLSAFEILKNSTKLQSLTSSMIGQEGDESPDEKSGMSPAKDTKPAKAPIWAKAAPEAQSRRDLRTQTVPEKDGQQEQRESSIQKRMFFQRMLTMDKNDGEDSPQRMNSPQKLASDQNKVRTTSVKPSTNKETETRLLKDFLGEDSPSTTKVEDSQRSRAPAAGSRPTEERSNSVQALLKVKPFWHKEEEAKEPENYEPSDYICHWVDHSAKYGLVFLMHSGTVGFLFNDQTKILFKPSGEKFVYLAKNATKHREEVKIYNINFPPKELEKKMAILKEVLPTVRELEPSLNLTVDETPIDKTKERVYVKNWVKAKQVIVFKLSNIVYQAVFQDKTEVLMSSKAQSILFIDKDKKKQHYALSSPDITNNRGLSARIDYFKKVLRKWVERDSNTTHLSRGSLVLTQPIVNSTSSDSLLP